MAVLLSFLCPGLGHLYNGRPVQGLLFFVLAVVGYMAFIVPGVLVHLFVLVDSARDGRRQRDERDVRQAELLADALARKQR